MKLATWPRERRALLDTSNEIFAEVSKRYDCMKGLLSWGQELTWKRRALERLVAVRSGRCLDLATGTGDIPVLMARVAPEMACYGLDLNRAMLRRAVAGATGLRRRVVCADFSALPYASGSFDVVTIGYGLRYAPDLGGFFQEARRVLRPGGVLFSFDIGHPRNGAWRRLWMAYLLLSGSLMGLVLHWRLTTYWHLVESLRAFPEQPAVRALMRESGFATVQSVEIMNGALVAHGAS